MFPDYAISCDYAQSNKKDVLLIFELSLKKRGIAIHLIKILLKRTSIQHEES